MNIIDERVQELEAILADVERWMEGLRCESHCTTWEYDDVMQGIINSGPCSCGFADIALLVANR